MKLLNSLVNKFTQVPNELILDNTISAQSRFLFTYLAMRPDGWKWNNNEIMAVVGCKKNSLTKYFNELINAGWLSKYQQKADGGKFGNNVIELHSEKQTVSQNLGNGSPCPKKSATENIRSGKIGTLNNTDIITNTDIGINNEGSNKKSLFRNSVSSNVELFAKTFENEWASGIDLVYYYNAVKDWSDSKHMMRTARGWNATVRQFMRGDKDKGKLKMIQEAPPGLSDYLNL